MKTSPYIDFSTMSGIILESVLNSITDCLKIAGKHKGRVFGGYVRNVIVPRLQDPKCQIIFKDVDIWFQTQDAADSFIKEMGLSLVESIPAFSVEGVQYNFTRKQYYLYQYGTCIAWIDVIVSERIPVNDFNVNKLTYIYAPSPSNPSAKSFGDESVTTLIEAIHKKHATMLPEYINLLLNNTPMANKRLERINRIFFHKGWTISCLTQIPQNVDLRWIRQHLIPTPIHSTLPVGSVSSQAGVSPSKPYTSSQAGVLQSKPYTSSQADKYCDYDSQSVSPSKSCESQSKVIASLTTSSVLTSINDPSNSIPIVSASTSKDEAIAAFNMGLEAMKLAFLKMAEIK